MTFVNEPIAVIGTGCRFPGQSTSPSKLWDLLQKPRDVQSKIDRFKAGNWHSTDGHHHGASNVLDAYMLSDEPRAFDSQFFNIQAGEADSIDPQQRVLLEVVYESIEAAGLTLESLQGTPTAVYVGVMCDDYTDVIYYDSESIPKYAATGSARSILSNRVSYFFNWNGPSMTIDTACSSSLVAVHQALQVLRSGESRVAVAAGSNLIFGPKMFIAESNLNMLSPTGRSRAWDADADGYARGEGVAAVVLKKLSDAVADGDSIECIIRETGVNQDGRTPGITMPSSHAQANLIRDTYAKAGLDLTKKTDRCQYFEAHGTGTKAGDPQEAGAIYKSFFAETGVTDPEDILYVGSIKTVIGHTEGTAGVAGLIKASLAIQNKTVPPNMLFNRLNPDLVPFYDHLNVPTKAGPWPDLPEGTPRRVSVNSFGFGGTNAHAIVESYEPVVQTSSSPENKVAIPFTFAATSEKSLTAQLRNHVDFLADNKDIDLRALAWTLSRRSDFGFRASFSAGTVEDLCGKLEAALEAKRADNVSIGTRPVTKGRGIFGVFTGQGAQWAGMGRELILTSPFVESIVDQLEQSLADLPATDRPAWSLKKEMLAVGAESRIGEGLMSQPLCTAVQVVLVDLLRKAGIDFEAVVGHSSGEIGACYAAGFISARDAIRIAYYRGFYAKLAKGRKGENGSMLAAGTSMDDAHELCGLRAFKERLQLAASNSSASVTLSGNADAVAHAKDVFEDEGKFARQLKVDTAYHSHHMLPCGDAYVQSLKACDIQIQPPRENCRWYSSVFGGQKMSADHEDLLKGEYWMDNMLNPVLFSQAITEAFLDIETPAIALEIGPHPALKGPASLVIEEYLGNGIPYAGVLSRGKNDVEAFADGLGFVWACLGSSKVDFTGHAGLFSKDPCAPNHLLKNIPSYAWDHDRAYWYESRASRTQRLRKDPPHQLLGIRTSDEGEEEFRWRNFIKPSEIPWLRGHAIQGQVLFPAAGFGVMAVEASRVLAPTEDVRLIELHQFSIHRALSFPDEAAGVETVFTLSNIKRFAGEDGFISVNFNCDACLNKDSGHLTSVASGNLILRLGDPSITALPDRPAASLKMTDTDVDDFYSSLASTGYNYSGIFRGISELQRTADLSAGIISCPADPEEESPFIIHPAVLDVAFQSIFAAIGAPGDGRLWTLHVPTMIDKIKINPLACPAGAALGADLPFDAEMMHSVSPGQFSGNLTIYEESGRHALVQGEGLHVSPVATPTKADDRPMFAETIWGLGEPNAELVYKEFVDSALQAHIGVLAERASLFYLHRLQQTITAEERKSCDEHRTRVLEWADHVISVTGQGMHPHLKKEYLKDTFEDLNPQMLKACEDYEDFTKLMFIGERLVPFIRGEISMVEEFVAHNMLDWFYKGTEGTVEYNDYVGKIVKQIAYRYPGMKILEIGAGTGSATESILNEIGSSYCSYTFTDISAGFFEAAMSNFKDHSAQFAYKVLDIDNDVKEQGFSEHSYDLIVAGNVLHATHFLDKTLTNVRKLLKPGGYLVLFEITEVDWLRTGFMFSGMHGWWAGSEDGRALSPTISKPRWDALFRKTGFSGIDTATPDPKSYFTPYSVMVTQAVDTQMSLIRQPLSTSASKPEIDELLILGGQQMSTYDLVESVSSHLKPFCSKVSIIERLEDLNDNPDLSRQSVLCLCELDEHVFKPFTPEKYRAVQDIMERARNVLWVTKGARGEQPYSSMMLGVARCVIHERKESINLQAIDFSLADVIHPQFLAEAVLRLHIFNSWRSFAKSYRPQWSLEQEMSIVNGDMEIPRYRQKPDQDDRYNSTRRLIKSPVHLDTATIAITPSHELEEYTPAVFETELEEKDCSTIRVRRSVLTAFKIKAVGFAHLVIGEDTKNGKKLLALSDTHRSMVTVPTKWTVDCNMSEEQESGLLLAVANEFVAEAILGKAKSSSSFLVHEPSTMLTKALSRQASRKGISMAFTSATAREHGIDRIHPSTSDRLLKSHIPADVSTYVNLSKNDHAESLGVRIEGLIPGNCKRKHSSALFSQEVSIEPGLSHEHISETLNHCYAQAVLALPADNSFNNAKDVSLVDVYDLPAVSNNLRAVNWATTTPVPVKSSLSENSVRFRNNHTYFLVGLAGELGLSTCRWMIARGAKYLALASRNPQVDQKWLDAMQAEGVTVGVYAVDITNRASLMKAYRSIRKELPPIAGVCNGAMILKDGLFSQMPYETFNTVIRPKVDGTLLLDELFPDNSLDFFILYSSLTCVTGNIGQAPYAAANAFMVNLAERRRKHGLAASVMNLAGIFGIGYITRTDKSIHERLGNMGYANISEWDYHQFFAEAVMASHPDSGKNFEISTGLKSIDPEKDSNLPAWFPVAKFANYTVSRSNLSEGKTGQETVSVKAQLKDQTTEDGAYETLLDGLLSNLYHRLDLPPEENAITPESSLVEFGIDSLVAVDMRSWFANELELDMPVLKLLGGSTVAEVARDALERLPRSLIPNVTSDSNKSDSEEASSTDETSNPEQSDATEPSLSESTPPSSSVSVVGDHKEDVVTTKPKLEIQKTVRMSYGSSQFWFLTQYMQDPDIYNTQLRISMSSAIQVNRLEQAIESLGQRHEALRTAYVSNPERLNEPMQAVLATSQLRLVKRNITTVEEADKQSTDMLNYAFQIDQGEVGRVILLSLSPTQHFMIFTFHHIAIDGFSLNLFLLELNALYEGQQLPPMQFQYSDFAVKQRHDVESGYMERELKFWRQELGPELPEPLPLFPMAKTNSRLMLTRYDYEEAEEIVLDPETTAKVKDLCRKHKATKFHFFLTILKIFLFRFLDTEDLCIGMADANRTDSNFASTIGYFLNLLPLRFRLNSKQTFADAMKESRTKIYSALSHSKLPFDVMLDDLRVPRSSTHNPLFQAFIDYRQMSAKAPLLGAQSDGVPSPGRTAYDILLDINDVSSTNEIRINIRTQKYLYSRRSTELLLKSYVHLVKGFVSDTRLQLSKTPLLKAPLYDTSDISTATKLSRGNALDVGSPTTASQRIENVILANANSIALKDGRGIELSYKAMSDRVDAISSSLLDAGSSEGSCVAVYQQPTSDWICSLLAIWKIGAAFVPLDPRNPLERLAIIVNDCKPSAILCHDLTSHDANELRTGSASIVDVSNLRHPSTKVVSNASSSKSLALILYTSGSTGVPKGIMLSHEGILNHLVGLTQEFKTGKEKILQQTAYSFDLAILEVLGGLLGGGTLFVVPKSKRLDPREVAKLIVEENITGCLATPSECFAWLRHGSEFLTRALDLKFVIAAGEVLTYHLVQEFLALQRPPLRLFNLYGPGEISIGCSTFEIDNEDLPEDPKAVVPIGNALPNYAVYVTDRNLDVVPVGVAGEIIIGGVGVAQGYVNNQELTNQKFLKDKYSSSEKAPKEWSTVYRSGDMGVMRDDGAIVCMGRMEGDTQIKLNGIRIEISDIENTIVEASNGVIFKAIASLRGKPEFLAAFVEFSSAYPASERGHFLKNLLARLPLPKYMCPTMMIPVDSIPLNNHGKTDRRAVAKLPLPQEAHASGLKISLSRTESTLKQLWEEVVSKDIVEAVGIDGASDFFHVGGDSLTLVSLQARIRERFGVVLKMIDLLEASTLRAMASKIESSSSVTAVNWKQETALDPALKSDMLTESVRAAAPPATKSSDYSVLLTGATGYLGRRILQQLVSDARVSRIHCVAIRPTADSENRKLPIESPKITVHPGDLSLPMLGLSESSFQTLASSVDIVFHSGANRSFWDYYQAIRGSNFSSTRELTKLAAPRKIPIHFISSSGVLDLASPTADTTAAASVSSCQPPTDGTNGYIASKWASEVYLEHAAQQLGLPVRIHRVVPSPSSSNSTSSPPPEMLAEFSKLAVEMKTLPDPRGWSGSFDLVHTMSLAQALCNAALQPLEPSVADKPSFTHHMAETRLHMADVEGYMGIGEKEREGFEMMAPHQWVGRAKKLGLGWHFAGMELGIGGDLTLKR
ncbi:MAG: hypothetical protein Q9227_006201 [Pyrenula ochraceoflavens]